MTLLVFPVISALVAAATIAAMLASGRTGPLDVPNARSLHTAPMPSSGGLGILAGILPAAVAADVGVPLLAGALLLAVVSWWDARHPLSVQVRLGCQLIAASLAVGALPGWGPASSAVVLLAVVWMTNLYNFMDGADGLAGGMTVLGFGAYAVVAATSGQPSLAMLSASVSAAAIGFLAFNFHPARIFMGDVGSVPLGFLAAVLGIVGIRSGLWPVWFPVLVFSPFIVDATVTLARRILRGERVWEGHRTHYYQRLVGSGWTHRVLALRAYGLMAAAATSACLTLHGSTAWQVAGLLAWCAVYAVLLRWIDAVAPR